MQSERPELHILGGGFLSTIQDLGRPGFTHLGISPGGAADPVALKIGNRLVGNSEGMAAIEMTLSGVRINVSHPTWMAVAGGDFELTINRVPMTCWQAFRVGPNDVVEVGACRTGARAYLCVRGGVDVEKVLSSRSTFVSGTWGGLEGRALTRGDRLPIGRSDEAGPLRRTRSSVRRLWRTHENVRLTQGPQWAWFSYSTREKFLRSEYTVTESSNRNGVRLNGERVVPARAQELLSEGISDGAIQIPADGHPIILFCEQRTTGGYPKIANVIQADRFRLGQLRPGQKVTFELVTLDRAWQINREREKTWASALTDL